MKQSNPKKAPTDDKSAYADDYAMEELLMLQVLCQTSF